MSIKHWIPLRKKTPDSHFRCLAFFVCAAGLTAGYAHRRHPENLKPIFKFSEVAICIIRPQKFFWTFFLKGKVHLPFTLYPLFQRAKERGWTHELCRTSGSDSGSAVHKAARYIPQPGIWISGFERNHPAGYSRPHVFLAHRNGTRPVWRRCQDCGRVLPLPQKTDSTAGCAACEIKRAAYRGWPRHDWQYSPPVCSLSIEALYFEKQQDRLLFIVSM